MFSTLNRHVNKKTKRRQQQYFCRIYILIIFIIILSTFFISLLILTFMLPEKSLESQINDISPMKTDVLLCDLQNSSSNYIYIDIGCYNGETIEHFLYFTPNSTYYDIFIFEPDPVNYLLCKQRLSQNKYAHVNITILQKVAWIRDEKVSFITNRGPRSRLITNTTMENETIEQLDAIDFSSWLACLAKQNKTKIHIKMSMPGAEVPVIDKMIFDGTIDLVEKYEVEWLDRRNPFIRSTRIYLQLMLDNRGFDCLYYTRLEDVRNIFKINGTYGNVTKYYNWQIIEESDTFGHYKIRPDMFELPRKIKKIKE